MSDREKIKCVIWDLDNTIWDGILLENLKVKLKSNVIDVIKRLDEKGILHSIASKNHYETAINKLNEFGIAEYFIYPQINWNSKAESIKKIADEINIGMNAIAFIDDQQFELDEVYHTYNEILCIPAYRIDEIPQMERFCPKFITEDSKLRRLMYINDLKRNELEKEFVGSKEEFLKTLNIELIISKAKENDLKRVEELTIRTHQLNTTGIHYDYEQLLDFINNDHYKLYVTSLKDKYGDYGKVGILLAECAESIWNIKLLLMSCRVISRGVGQLLMNFFIEEARKAKVKLLAEFVHNEKNRMMYITYKFNGFKEVKSKDNNVIFEYDFNIHNEFPNYVKVVIK